MDTMQYTRCSFETESSHQWVVKLLLRLPRFKNTQHNFQSDKFRLNQMGEKEIQKLKRKPYNGNRNGEIIVQTKS